MDFFVKMIDGEVDFSTFANASPARMQAIINGIGVRTKYFDDYFWPPWTRVCVKR